MITKKYIKPVLFVVGIMFITINPYIIIQSVKNSLIICYESIIPSLFIFMALSNYAAQQDILYIFGLPFRWFSRLMKIDSNDYSGYMFLSMLGGFAAGAKFIKQMENSGYPQKTLSVIGIAMINNSFAFCAFTVGTGMLKNYYVGLILYISTLTASMITAFLLSFIIKYNIVIPQSIQNNKPVSLAKAINDAVSNVLSVCGFVITFNTLCEVILLYTSQSSDLSVFSGIFTEVTTGIIRIINHYNSDLYLICFALSILPLSTICQVYHFTENPYLIKTLIYSRIIHTPVSLLIFSLLTNLFPVECQTMAIENAVYKSFSYSSELSFTLFIIALIFIKIFDKNKLFTNSQ